MRSFLGVRPKYRGGRLNVSVRAKVSEQKGKKRGGLTGLGCWWDIIEKSSPVNATAGSRSWPVGSRKLSLGRQPGPWAGRCLSQDNLPVTAAMGGAGFEAKLSSGSKRVGGRWGWGHVGWLTKCNSQRQSRREASRRQAGW